MKQIEASVGIIGMGSFGSFINHLLPKSLNILVNDPVLDSKSQSTIDEIAACDAIVLAVPLAAYDSILAKLAKLVKPSSLIIDVCSVKQLPEKKFKRYLPGHPNILLTHPLFGSQSAARTTKDHDLIVTVKKGKVAEKVINYCETELGLHISYMSGSEHDQIMAQVHALTFFIARSLNDMGLPESAFKTPSYSMIDRFISIDKSHSEDLFKTIEAGNKFSKEIRSKFLDAAKELDRSIDKLMKEL